MKKVIVTNGSGGCGKDSVAKLIQKHFTVYKYSSISKVKDVATICGYDGGKSEKDRRFLSDLKLLSVDYSDMPMNDLRMIYNRFLTDTLEPCTNDKYTGLVSDFPSAQLLIIDIREPAEIKKAADEFNAITVLIDRSSVVDIKSNMADANVDNYDYDYYISNDNTLEHLEHLVVDFLEWLKVRV